MSFQLQNSNAWLRLWLWCFRFKTTTILTNLRILLYNKYHRKKYKNSLVNLSPHGVSMLRGYPPNIFWGIIVCTILIFVTPTYFDTGTFTSLTLSLRLSTKKNSESVEQVWKLNINLRFDQEICNFSLRADEEET